MYQALRRTAPPPRSINQALDQAEQIVDLELRELLASLERKLGPKGGTLAHDLEQEILGAQSRLSTMFSKLKAGTKRVLREQGAEEAELRRRIEAEVKAETAARLGLAS